MLSKRYVDMLSEKDIIFEIAGMAKRRAQEIGEENVYNFSLGNPSVPAPEAVNQTIHDILNDTPTLRSTAMAPAPGCPRSGPAGQSLNRRSAWTIGPSTCSWPAVRTGALGHPCGR